MMINKLCSIIIPFYKGANFLENAVNSILKTTYSEIEIIIVDDGTPEEFIPDNYWNHIAGLDTRIVIYHKNNGGIADTRNYGLSHAKGEFIAFFDQDDVLEGDMYSDLIPKMVGTNSDFVSSNVYHLLLGKKVDIHTIKKTCILTGKSIQEIRKWLLMKEVWQYNGEKIDTTIWNCIFRKSIIDEHSLIFYSNLVYDDDWNFLIRYLEVCNTAFLSSHAYYIWTVRMDSESHKRRYVKKLPSKFRNHYQFKYNQIKSLLVSEVEMTHFKEYFFADKYSRLLMNESVTVKNLSSYFKAKEVLIRVLKEDSAQYSTYGCKRVLAEKGRRAAMIYWFLLHRMFLLAFLIAIA